MPRTTVWLTGASGRLGSALVPVLHKDRSLKVIETDQELDIADRDEVRQFCAINQPDIIINCASFTDRIETENDRVQAFRTNTLGARNLAAISNRNHAVLIQMSTDDVFNGTQGDLFMEFDTPNPGTIYGKSKLSAETLVRELNPRHIIVRVPWIYGPGKNDFYQQILESARKGERIPASEEWIMSPTSTGSIARFIHKLIEHPVYGTFHAADKGQASRYEFVQEVLRLNGYDPGLALADNDYVKKTPLEDLMMEITGIHEMPDWKEDLKAFAEAQK